MSHVLPPHEYYRRLPRNIAGAGVILRDGERFLLVKPSYRSTWEIPGGGLEEGEYPWEAARREVREETGLEVTPGRLVAVDWVPALDDGRPPLANFVFDAGLLGHAEAEQRIRLQDGELTSWTMAGPPEWDSLLAPRLDRRLRACAGALATGTTAYLQDGQPPPAGR